MKRSGIRGFIGNKGTISRIPLRCIQATNFKLHLAGSIVSLEIRKRIAAALVSHVVILYDTASRCGEAIPLRHAAACTDACPGG